MAQKCSQSIYITSEIRWFQIELTGFSLMCDVQIAFCLVYLLCAFDLCTFLTFFWATELSSRGVLESKAEFWVNNGSITYNRPKFEKNYTEEKTKRLYVPHKRKTVLKTGHYRCLFKLWSINLKILSIFMICLAVFTKKQVWGQTNEVDYIQLIMLYLEEFC